MSCQYFLFLFFIQFKKIQPALNSTQHKNRKQKQKKMEMGDEEERYQTEVLPFWTNDEDGGTKSKKNKSKRARTTKEAIQSSRPPLRSVTELFSPLKSCCLLRCTYCPVPETSSLPASNKTLPKPCGLLFPLHRERILDENDKERSSTLFDGLSQPCALGHPPFYYEVVDPTFHSIFKCPLWQLKSRQFSPLLYFEPVAASSVRVPLIIAPTSLKKTFTKTETVTRKQTKLKPVAETTTTTTMMASVFDTSSQLFDELYNDIVAELKYVFPSFQRVEPFYLLTLATGLLDTDQEVGLRVFVGSHIDHERVLPRLPFRVPKVSTAMTNATLPVYSIELLSEEEQKQQWKSIELFSEQEQEQEQEQQDWKRNDDMSTSSSSSSSSN